MLVSEFFERVYEEIDKEGMPYFEEAELLRRFKTATYFFLEESVPFIQIDQKAKEDLGMLTFEYVRSEDPQNQNEMISFPNDFYRLVSLTGIYDQTQRPIKIVQSNDLETLKDDPFNTPEEKYPLAEFYQNSIRVQPLPNSIKGLYLKHPVFNTAPGSELVEGLPIHIQLFLIEKVVLHLMTTIGDERYQMQYYQTQKKVTDS